MVATCDALALFDQVIVATVWITLGLPWGHNGLVISIGIILDYFGLLRGYSGVPMIAYGSLGGFAMVCRRFAELTFSFGSVTDATGQGPGLLSFKVNCQDDSRRRLLHCISSSLINIDIDST